MNKGYCTYLCEVTDKIQYGHTHMTLKSWLLIFVLRMGILRSIILAIGLFIYWEMRLSYFIREKQPFFHSLDTKIQQRQSSH